MMPPEFKTFDHRARLAVIGGYVGLVLWLAGFIAWMAYVGATEDPAAWDNVTPSQAALSYAGGTGLAGVIGAFVLCACTPLGGWFKQNPAALPLLWRWPRALHDHRILDRGGSLTIKRFLVANGYLRLEAHGQRGFMADWYRERLPAVVEQLSSFGGRVVKIDDVSGERVAVTVELFQTAEAAQAVRDAQYEVPAPVEALTTPEHAAEKAAGWRERLCAVEVGSVVDTDQPWRLRLIDTHVLVAGSTGAGKASVLWSAILSPAPGVAAGVVRLWGIDPKRMELAMGSGLFATYASKADEIVGMLDAAAQAMLTRADHLRRQTRRFEPSTDYPLEVIIIDELGYLLALAGDRSTRQKLELALNTLLVLGRSVGFLVLAAIQDPRKETLPNRDLFPVRVAMRLPAEMVRLVLGPDALAAGAAADKIPVGEAGAGQAYVLDEYDARPQLVRAFWISDRLIQLYEQSLKDGRFGEHLSLRSLVEADATGLL